jgi:hypothetical protein
VPPIVSLHLIFALNKGLLGLQPFIRFLVLVMFPSCCCMSRLPIVMRRLSLLPMRLKQGSETPFMDVLHIFFPCSNRFVEFFVSCLLTIYIDIYVFLFFLAYFSSIYTIDHKGI